MGRSEIRSSLFLWIVVFEGTLTIGTSLMVDEEEWRKTTEHIFCETQTCKQAAEEILDSLDNTVDPCDNFWSHVCGRWTENHPKTSSQQNVIARKTQSQLKSLRKEILGKHETENGDMLQKLSDYYRSCINFVKAETNDENLKRLETIVSDNGGWPITYPLNEWKIVGSLTLQRIHGNYLRLADHGALFDIDVSPVDLGSGERTYVTRLTLPARQVTNTGDFFSADTIKAAVVKLAPRLRGSIPDVAGVAEEVKEMLEFEKSLFEFRSNTYQLLNVVQLQNMWNEAVSGHSEYAINWLESIRWVFKKTGIEIDEKTDIVVEPKDIVEKLGNLLKKTSLRTVVNYVHWNAIAVLAPHADKQMANIINGPQTDVERSVRCLTDIKMGHGLSYIYVKKFFELSTSTQADIRDMIAGIEARLKPRISRSTWLDDEMKSRFKNKIDAIIANIGYPSWYDKPEKINKYYKKLNVGSNYFQNEVNYNKFRRIKSLKKLRKDYDRYNAEWPVQATKTNAIYSRVHNSINFPAVLLQMPFYDIERPRVFNYGSLGFLIGHEIGHAIDQLGQWFDWSGVPKSLPAKHVDTYEEKSKCLEDQYSRYTVVGPSAGRVSNVNGSITLSENMADEVGARAALGAHLTRMEKNDPKNFKDPVVWKMNVKQFFYSFANSFCASRESYGHGTTYAPHSVRVNGVVSNMPKFSQAFDCPSGKPMNPSKKCDILN